MECKKTAGRLTAIVITALVLCIVGGGTLWAVPASCKIKLQQVYVDYPSITIFADLSDAAGNPVFPATSDKIAANIDGEIISPSSTDVFSKLKNGAAVVYAVDVSSSLSAEKFAELKAAVVKQIKKMSDRDYAAVVAFGDGTAVRQDFTNKQDELLKAISALKAADKITELKAGIISALDLASVINSALPERRLVVLCTDGYDDAVTNTTDNEVKEKIKSAQIPMYALVYDPLKTPKFQRTNLSELSRLSGGTAYQANKMSFADIIDAIDKQLNQSLRLKFDVRNIKSTGGISHLNLIYSNGTLTTSDGCDVRLIAKSQAADKQETKKLKWYEVPSAKFKSCTKNEQIVIVSLSFAILVLLVLLIVILAKRRKKAKAEREVETKTPEKCIADADSSAIKMPVTSVATQRVGSNVVGRTERKRSGLRIELHHTGNSSDQKIIRAVVADSVVLGRDPFGANSIVIQGDKTISSHHCKLTFADGRLYVVDLKSTNGTYVNGVAINSKYPLNDEDMIAVGKTELRLKIVGSDDRC